MNYNVFGNEVKQEVEKLLGTEVRVELRQITKNNGIILDGICILEKGCNVSPTIYLEEFYREYKNGMSLREIASRICEVYEKRCRGIPFSLEYFLDFEKMKERIFCKLINWELNKELLNEVPNIPCLDLAVVFVCAVENEEFGNGSILVREEHRKLWRVSKELLYEYARENTFRLRPFELKSMEELIEDMVEPEEKKLLKEIPMYVLSNQKRVFGAAGLLYDRVLSDAGVRLEDDFYVLPSSVHEVILVPDHVAGSEKDSASWFMRSIIPRWSRRRFSRRAFIITTGRSTVFLSAEIAGFPAVLNKIEEISHKNLTFSKRCGMIASLLSRREKIRADQQCMQGKNLHSCTRTRSSGDRAAVSGTACRGFESLRVCFFVYVNLFPRTMSHACMEISDFREHRREPEVQEFVGGRE